MAKAKAKTFDFKDQLRLSYASSNLFDGYYRNFGFVKQVIVHTDLETQKRGIDKTLVFQDGSSITIDEKFDTHLNSPNMFLELYTSFGNYTKGWLYTAECDYVVYGYIDGRVYWLPTKILRHLWFKHHTVWANGDTIKYIPNKGYVGMGVVVGMDEVCQLVYDHTIVEEPPSWERVCPNRIGCLFDIGEDCKCDSFRIAGTKSCNPKKWKCLKAL